MDKGFSLEKLGRYREAIEHYRRSLDVNPADRQPLVNIGQCWLYLESYPDACSCFEMFLAAEPGAPKGLHGVLRAAAGAGDFEKALRASEGLIRANEPLDAPPVLILRSPQNRQRRPRSHRFHSSPPRHHRLPRLRLRTRKR
jgi:tetratricopeptide (TPR) repeat protein